MELFLIPLVGITGLYLINKQEKRKTMTETFSKQESLPNTNVPDKNYPNTDIINNNTDLTSNLMNVK